MNEPPGDDPGAFETVSFPFDRMTVQRFREAFPRARWNDELKAWKVPGKTAGRRVERWLVLQAARRERFAEEKGRDAFSFEPILSPYLEVSDTGFRIRTPYSRRVVDELRQIAFARWDPELRAWHIPFASYDELQERWETIEEAARHAEPDERRKRAEARKGTEEERKQRRRNSERKRRRLPAPCHALPPLERPLMTATYGMIVVTEITGELVEAGLVEECYPAADDEHVWCSWRLPTLDELVHTWPAKEQAHEGDRRRGWWQPTIDELRPARRAARSREARTARQA